MSLEKSDIDLENSPKSRHFPDIGTFRTWRSAVSTLGCGRPLRSIVSPMLSDFQCALAAQHLVNGSVIAYPTEGVFGLGCLPQDTDAVRRVIELKQRDARKGMILLAAVPELLRDWIDDSVQLPNPDPDKPITWIVPAGVRCDDLITGGRDTVAVRISRHPVAAALSYATGSPIVSTSANVSGGPAIRNRQLLQKHFGNKVEYIVPGQLGGARGASEIRHLHDSTVLRSAGAK